MDDGFADLIDVSNRFFAELAQNNRREWFQERKDFYAAEIKKPAELLADFVAGDISRLTGKPHQPKLFRIHRDVRFSKDKTPYNPHLHLQWRPKGSETAPSWFLGSSPEYLIVAMGVMAPKGESLSRYRALVDGRGDEIAATMDAARAGVGASLSDWGAAPLKRVPKPYDPDNPHGDLLRRKTLIIEAPLPENWRDAGLLPTVASLFTAMLPLWRLLDEHLS